MEPFGFLTAVPEQLETIRDLDYPRIEFSFYLSNKKVTYIRQVYTVFTALGDFGGFNGAIMTFPAVMM